MGGGRSYQQISEELKQKLFLTLKSWLLVTKVRLLIVAVSCDTRDAVSLFYN